MAHVAPWRSHYFADNFVRRMIHPPRRLLGPHLSEGAVALDVGCGMGVFAMAMARMMGPAGRVVAVDVEQRALDVLVARAERAGLADRITARRCAADDIGVSEPVDFALAFWMVHEVPDAKRFMVRIRECLKPTGRFLMAEPIFHVSRAGYRDELRAARSAGLEVYAEPRVWFSRAAVFKVSDSESEVSGQAGGGASSRGG